MHYHRTRAFCSLHALCGLDYSAQLKWGNYTYLTYSFNIAAVRYSISSSNDLQNSILLTNYFKFRLKNERFVIE